MPWSYLFVIVLTDTTDYTTPFLMSFVNFCLLHFAWSGQREMLLPWARCNQISVLWLCADSATIFPLNMWEHAKIPVPLVSTLQDTEDGTLHAFCFVGGFFKLLLFQWQNLCPAAYEGTYTEIKLLLRS